MRRTGNLRDDEIIPYNLRGDGNEFTVFLTGQPDRVMKTREVIAKTSLGPPYVHFWRHGTSCILGCGLYIMIGCGVLWPSWPVN